ncbi:MAG: class I SAM-dependent methyltransferase [Cruoricaptor ignavus]|nr:class I SAM-dependent methyltransferase [Cruoricaptor ignavus]
MINAILNPKVQDYIKANLHTDWHALLLKKSPFPDVTMQQIVHQINGRKIAEKKFPSLLKEKILFPPNLNLEQTSSQITAEYKAQNLVGNSFLDLTSGFGIDAFFLSKNFSEITLVEQNTTLLDLVKHNWEILGKNAKFLNQNLLQFLQENTAKYDLVYIDPARRDSQKKKVFLLEDLSPNLLEIQEKLWDFSNEIIIKLSPLIDLKYLISTLKFIYKIEIIAVKNEVKEVVVFIKPNFNPEKILCKCVNLETADSDFQFYFGQEEQAVSTFSEPESYLFIPNNSVLKSGAFNYVSEYFNLKKLHPNSHFYTSNLWIENFPGRILRVEKINHKQIKKGEQYNIISKNYPLKPEEIKKKFGLKDGGKHYLIFTQTQKGKLILKSIE